MTLKEHRLTSASTKYLREAVDVTVKPQQHKASGAVQCLHQHRPPPPPLCSHPICDYGSSTAAQLTTHWDSRNKPHTQKRTGLHIPHLIETNKKSPLSFKVWVPSLFVSYRTLLPRSGGLLFLQWGRTEGLNTMCWRDAWEKVRGGGLSLSHILTLTLTLTSNTIATFSLQPGVRGQPHAMNASRTDRTDRVLEARLESSRPHPRVSVHEILNEANIRAPSSVQLAMLWVPTRDS